MTEMEKGRKNMKTKQQDLSDEEGGDMASNTESE